MRPRPPKEAALLDRIRRALYRAGWTLVEKTHGNAFMAGWPDLYVARPGLQALGESNRALARRAVLGLTARERASLDASQARYGLAQCDARWVEVKRPTGRLTRAQRVRFAAWEDAGVGVWVLTSADELGLLDRGPNWRSWA